MKITLFELRGSDQDTFSNVFGDANISFVNEKLSEKNVDLAKDSEIICIFVNSAVNKNLIDAMPNLKFIATRSTGFDHIDCEYAKTKGINISTVPAYGSHTVAEFAFGLLLTLSRKIREATYALKENGDFTILENLQGFDLAGKTLGVLGTGKIGKNVIKIAKGFDMNIIAFDLYPDAVFAQENNFTYKTFEDVVSQSDIITLHAPSTKENFHLINKESIEKMKKGVYLINTARGDLIDTEALVSGLNQGIIAGAGLDVIEGEKGFKKGDIIPMLEMGNVVMTPHIAFNTKEAELRIMQTTIENIKGYIGGKPINLVS
jgi:D-lactate dehydrogenase